MLWLFFYEILQTVIIPPGVVGGNTILVRSPFGTRTVYASVPDGLKTGDKFTVDLPPVGVASEKPKSGGFMPSLDDFFTPTPEVVGVPVSSD